MANYNVVLQDIINNKECIFTFESFNISNISAYIINMISYKTVKCRRNRNKTSIRYE